MSKLDTPDNPADRGPETRTDGKHDKAKGPQFEGNRRPNRDLPRGAEGDTRRSSGMQR